MNKYKFGNLICNKREALGLTQIEFAKMLDVSDKAVSKWENGQAIPRMETLENIADIFGTTVEKIISNSKDTTNEKVTSVYFKNGIYSVLHLDVDGKLVSIKAGEGEWVDVNPSKFTVKASGEFDFDEMEDIAKEEEKLKGKIAIKFIKKAFDYCAKEAALFSECTYEFDSVPVDNLVLFDFDSFNMGDKMLVFRNFVISYPKVFVNGVTPRLIKARAKNKKDILRSFKKSYISSNMGLGFLFMLICYPFVMVYFKHLCRDDIILKNINKADYHKLKAEKQKKSKHPVISSIMWILFIIIIIIIWLCME